jgi:hypothetical protein
LKGYFAPLTEILELFLDWDNRSKEYKSNIIKLVDEFRQEGLTQEDINKLEALMRID